MLPPEGPDRIHIAFDDHRLVANARLILLTRRAIWDSDSPKTFSSPPTPAGRMAESAPMAAGVMVTTAPAASTSVLERTTVVKGAATRATSKRARSAAGSAVSKPRPRRRGWTAVSRMTARTSAVGAPVCPWGFANLAVVPCLALNLYKQEHSTRVDIKAKRKKAGWDRGYLLKVLYPKCDSPAGGNLWSCRQPTGTICSVTPASASALQRFTSS